MKNLFKKVLSLFIFLGLLFTLVACDNPTNEDVPTEEIKYGEVVLEEVHNGSAYLTRTGTQKVGTRINIVPKPDEGYKLEAYLLNGQILDDSIFEVVEGDNIVTVLFKRIEQDPPVDEEKLFTLNVLNFNKTDFMHLESVVPNPSYANEFTIQKTTGLISCDKISKITKVEVVLYGNYDNLVVYGSDDNPVTATTVTDSAIYNKGKIHLYEFDEIDEFRITNPSNYDVHLFEVNIYYKGNLDGTIPLIEEDGKIVINHDSYNRHSKLSTALVETDVDDLLFKPNGYIKSLDLGKITNITINSTSSISLYLVDQDGEQTKASIKIDNDKNVVEIDDEYTGFILINETDQELKLNEIIIEYEVPLIITDITISEAIQIANGLSRNKGVTLDYYRLSGDVTEVNGAEAILSDGTNTILCYATILPGNMNPGFKVTIVGKIQNYYGKAEIVEYFVESYIGSNYSLEALPAEHGTFVLSKTSDLAYDEVVTITATPDEGYYARYAIVEGTRYKFKDNVCQIYVKKDAKVIVEFAEIKEIDTSTDKSKFTIHSLEMVGTYGDANLIQYGDYDILIDAGTESDAMNLKTMLETYVTDGILDLIIISHPDSDHYYGITNGALNGVNEVKRLIVNNEHKETENIKQAVLEKSSDALIQVASQLTSSTNLVYTIEVDDLFSIDIMYNSYYSTTGKNNASIPAIINYKNTKLFMGGDMENSSCQAFMSMYPDLFSEDDYVMFKILHHGSNGSNSAEFLSYLKPDMAFVNAPMKTSAPNTTPAFSTHPYLEAMIRVGKETTDVYWSGLTGNLTIECDGYSSTVSGDVRTRDYKYYDSLSASYILADKFEEKNIRYFESKWYLEAILHQNAPDYLGINN